MKLYISDPLGQPEYELNVETTDTDVVEGRVSKLEWESLTGIRLEIDSLNWIELSGSNYDGFAIIYSDGKNKWLAKDGTESLEQGILAMQSYLMKGNEWKEMFVWEHLGKTGEELAGCASAIILFITITSIIVFGTYHLFKS